MKYSIRIRSENNNIDGIDEDIICDSYCNEGDKIYKFQNSSTINDNITIREFRLADNQMIDIKLVEEL